MIKKLYEMIYGREYELRERIFRMIILVGGTLAVLGMLECIMLMDIDKILIPLAILLVVIGVCFLLVFKYQKSNIAAIIVGFLIIIVVFPEMFFLSGGLQGGATLWFSLGILYVFLMFSGKRLVFFLGLSILTDAVTYWYGYYHPDIIRPMASQAVAYMDSFFAVVAVGLAGGAILKVQMKIFYIERSIAQKQQKELEEVSKSKNRFFTNISHEIRTPINTIIGLNEMILRESAEEETKEYARNIQSASKMLLNLVNDVLDLSQMEMQKMEIVPIQYQTVDLFGNLIDMIQIRLKEKKLEFQLDIDENLPSVLRGDVKRISQVILNILTNAVKYTETGSVTFSVHADSVQGDVVYLKISVQDTGIGIRKEDLEHIYDSFSRADARKNMKVEGSGLGLSITKQLVDLMDGEIKVDSIYTKGSTFTVLFPQVIEDRTPIGYVNFLSKGRERVDEYQQIFEAPEARILIVDDNHMNAMVEKKLLEATKVQVDIAESGAKCLEMTKRKYYHVILMDHMMPDMDGIDTIKALRRQENGLCRNSSVILLSANSVAEVGQSFLEEGFDGYLEKPIQGTALEVGILKFLPEDIVEYHMFQNEAENDLEIKRISRHKGRRVYITTDSVSDLPENMLEKYDIGMIPMYIVTGNGRFTDTREISSDNLDQYVTDIDCTAATVSASVEEYEEFFAEALTEAEQVIHIGLTRSLGESYSIAAKAAEGFDHVHVIDSKQMSCGQGLLVLYAGKLAMEGYRASEICELVEKMAEKIETCIIMPAVDIFSQRKFISRPVAKICELFGMHPVLKMKQGRAVLTGVRVGKIENAWKKFIRFNLRWKKKIHTDVILISQVGCSVEQQNLIRREIYRHVPFERVIMHRASVTTACNSGIGAFAFSYYRNTNED